VANIKSAIKRAKLIEVRTRRNKAVKTRVKTAARRVREALAAGQGEAAAAALRTAMSVIDRAASKGVLHPRTAARKKSRLARRLNQLQAAGGSQA
jgi:small subunit ribosomal protein S20